MSTLREAGRGLRAFGSLPWREKVVVLVALPLLVQVQLGLRLLRFDREYRLLALWVRGAGRLVPGAVPAERTGSLVVAVARRLPGPPTCLERALVLQALLIAMRRDASVVIATSREGEPFPGHAWVECKGRVVGDDEALVRATYVPVAALQYGGGGAPGLRARDYALGRSAASCSRTSSTSGRRLKERGTRS